MLEQANKIFGVRLSARTKNFEGNPIQYEVLEDRTDYTKQFVPARDTGYVFPLDAAMSVAMALQEDVKTPVLLWGMHGSGKSTLAEQVCSVLNMPAMRVQHSVDTEASDIVGQWVLKGDKTEFELGPLARAMRDGLVYIADEYDFALPNVLAVYQAVLEGGNLFIKQAPEHLAVVKPHKDFRIIATGNTNGSGDETGLYQGTQIQNAANYSRFGMTIKIDYQSKKVESEIICNKVLNLPAEPLNQIMEFAGKVREAYSKQTITNTLSTRELINIVKQSILTLRDNKINWDYGIQHGFTNRLSEIDKKAVENIAQRIFGGTMNVEEETETVTTGSSW